MQVTVKTEYSNMLRFNIESGSLAVLGFERLEKYVNGFRMPIPFVEE
jgi:hypothetical protein